MVKKSLAKTPRILPARLKTVMASAGLIALIFGVISGIVGMFHSARFIQNGFDLLSYAQYPIIIIGGASIGAVYAYFAKLKDLQLLVSVSFALITYIVYFFIDFFRILFLNFNQSIEYPLSMYIYVLMPFTSLLLLAGSALLASVYKNKSKLYRWAPWGVAAVFVFQQVTTVLASFVFTNNDYSGVALPLLVISLFTMPLSVAIASYFLLAKISTRGVRAFSATFIGLVFSLVTQSSWSFIFNPGSEYVAVFTGVAFIASLSFAATLLFFMRRALTRSVK
jgi:hypothetical protein